MKTIFTEKKFQIKTMVLIEQANVIIAEYQKAGFTLTLRQLYYQFVARDLIHNNMKSYKSLGTVINDGRLAGLIDWDAIEDRTRFIRKLPNWESGSEIIGSCANQFRKSKWDNQENRVEVWIEKDALVGVVEGICHEWDIPFFACRGYASQSELYRAGERFQEYIQHGQRPIVIHLGDHDPSGIDMTRDNESRLELFSRHPIEVKRIALNADQVAQYNPPPNPAKLSDSRAKNYIATHGPDSWELDALDPKVINDLIESEVLKYVDQDKWDIKVDEEDRVKSELKIIAADLRKRDI